MELKETRKVKAGGKDFRIGFSNRALIIQINRERKNPEDEENNFHYFYDLAKIGAKYAGEEFNYSFEEFYELIDPDFNAFPNFFHALDEVTGEDKKKLKAKE